MRTVALLHLLAGLSIAGCAHRGAPPPPDEYQCTQVMGVAVTAEWYAAGFEQGADGDRWQELARHGAYLPVWADPASPVWKESPSSPCRTSAGDPDRIILVAVAWDHTDTARWAASLDRLVDTLKARYRRLRRLELLTGLRGPGNQDCGSGKTSFPPLVDEALAAAAARHAPLVGVGPRFAMPSCAQFKQGGPYLTPEGNALAARMLREHYARAR